MKILDIYFAPSKVFSALKEKPRWVLPLVIVIVAVALAAVLTIVFAGDEIMARQTEALQERGLTDAQMEQAMQFTKGPIVYVAAVVNAVIFTVIILLLFSLVVNLFIPLFGGESSFKKVLSVVCWSSLVVVPSVILKIIIIAVTKSPYATTSLALLAPGLAKSSFMYQLLAGFDIFTLWEMILVAMGISITNNIVRKNAYFLVFVIWVISIFIGVGLASIFGRGA